jgi:hypothetical protein
MQRIMTFVFDRATLHRLVGMVIQKKFRNPNASPRRDVELVQSQYNRVLIALLRTVFLGL